MNSDHQWEVMLFDGSLAHSDDFSLAELPDKPIILIIRPGKQSLKNGSRYYFDDRYGWCEMENDEEALVTKLRLEVEHWRCYRPGWWDPDNERWRRRWHMMEQRAKDYGW